MSKIYEPIPDSLPVYGGIQAYSNLTSVTQKETIQFHVWIEGAVKENPQRFSVEIKREEDVSISITILNGFAFEQPTNQNPSENGCGWESSLEWNIPSDLKSGAYRATFRSGTDSTYLIFFVKPLNPSINNKILYVGSVTTWEAYND